MDPAARAELTTLLNDVRRVFGSRLRGVLAYGRHDQAPASTLVVVDGMTTDDLNACATRVAAWHRAGAATPLIFTQQEFERAADAFPIEYAEMEETAVVLDGVNPFATSGSVRPEDLRRACEVQARSHLLHLREDYLECAARPRDVAAMVRESAPGFRVLLKRLARLDGNSSTSSSELAAFAESRAGLDPRVIGDVLSLSEPAAAGAVDAARVFLAYLAAVERLAQVVDEWLHPSVPRVSSGTAR